MRDEWMNEQNTPDVELEERLTRALEARPAIHIPDDFAARVVRQLPERRPITLTPTNYGRTVMAICMVVLGVVLLAFALNGMAARPAVQITGWILYAQFLVLVLWFGMRGALRKLS